MTQLVSPKNGHKGAFTSVTLLTTRHACTPYHSFEEKQPCLILQTSPGFLDVHTSLAFLSATKPVTTTPHFDPHLNMCVFSTALGPLPA